MRRKRRSKNHSSLFHILSLHSIIFLPWNWVPGSRNRSVKFTSKRFIYYVSISLRDLHQKKLVLSSSESWCDDQLSHQHAHHASDRFLNATADRHIKTRKTEYQLLLIKISWWDQNVKIKYWSFGCDLWIVCLDWYTNQVSLFFENISKTCSETLCCSFWPRIHLKRRRFSCVSWSLQLLPCEPSCQTTRRLFQWFRRLKRTQTHIFTTFTSTD